MITNKEIQQLEELQKKATPGPWVANLGKYHVRAIAKHPKSHKRKQYVVAQSPQMLVNIIPQRLDDFEFLVMLRNSLLARLREAEGLLERVLESEVVKNAPFVTYSEAISEAREYFKKVEKPQ